MVQLYWPGYILGKNTISLPILHEMLKDICLWDLSIAVLVEHIEYESKHFLPREGIKMD